MREEIARLRRDLLPFLAARDEVRTTQLETRVHMCVRFRRSVRRRGGARWGWAGRQRLRAHAVVSRNAHPPLAQLRLSQFDSR